MTRCNLSCPVVSCCVLLLFPYLLSNTPTLPALGTETSYYLAKANAKAVSHRVIHILTSGSPAHLDFHSSTGIGIFRSRLSLSYSLASPSYISPGSIRSLDLAGSSISAQQKVMT
ncbi:hypothetical protein F5Y14DRAFT_339251 [Nemania sp. NC0429]|nr:hypothetical protein F5Y14DRAFT_339251 [Nemania sp. NC0429]